MVPVQVIIHKGHLQNKRLKMGLSFFGGTPFFGGFKGKLKENHNFGGSPKKRHTLMRLSQNGGFQNESFPFGSLENYPQG